MFDKGVERALAAALEAHVGQTRRGSDRPYVVHPLHVSLLLAHVGADPEVVQAGILHDVVEDCEGWTLARVASLFGERVAGLVAEVSEDKSKTWEERKEHQVESVPGLSAGALLIKSCDKLHNLRTLGIALTGSEDQDLVWGRFSGGRERTIEKSSRLVDALALRLGEGSELATALHEAMRVVAEA